MNRFTNAVRNFGGAVAERFNAAKFAMVGAVGTALAAANAPVFAGDLADAVTTEVTTAKTEILLVAAIMLGLTGVILLIKYVRKAAH